MGRVWEAHKEDAICDVCGKRTWCWDLYGDLICPACSHAAFEKEKANNEATGSE